VLAQKEAALHFPPLSDRQRLIAGPIEAHMRLQRCSRPVTPVVSAGAHMRDRILVELRCPGALPWHIYVPVRLVGTSPVAIAARAIVAGSILTDKDVRIEQRDIPELPAGYLDDPTVAVGLTAARPISSGAVITNQYLLWREGRATRPNGDAHRRFRAHEHPHGGQSAERCLDQSTG
jgi:flagella basal body P-ring formation protein FlgA